MGGGRRTGMCDTECVTQCVCIEASTDNWYALHGTVLRFLEKITARKGV